MNLKVKEMKVLKTLERILGFKDIEYNIMTKTFIYKNDEDVKDITFATILANLQKKELTTEEKEAYEMLDMLNSSYFPRRFKNLFENIYKSMGVDVPCDLFITTKGIMVDEQKGFIIEYKDDWETIIKEYEKFYNKDILGKKDYINFEDYKGEYHK